MKKKLMLLAATIVMVLPLFLGFLTSVTVQAADGEGDITFILHKKRYETNDNPGSTENTGDIMTGFDSKPGLGEVKFDVYNVTDAFYTLLETEDPDSTANPKENYSYEKAMEKVKNETSLHGSSVANGITAATENGAVKIGDLTLSGLDSKTNGKNSVYVIVETPKDGVTIADNMVIVLPVKDNKKTIHLYPKNIVKTGELEVEKVSNLSSATKVAGAKFVIHRNGKYGEDAAEYLTGFNNSGPIWVKATEGGLAAAKKYTTSNVGKFEEKGGLLYGNYYLTEIEAPAGYEIHDGAIDVAFTINSDSLSLTDGDAIINDQVNVEKTNTGGSVEVGSSVNYSVTTTVPTGIDDTVMVNGQATPRYSKFEIVDEHSKFLEFDATGATLSFSDDSGNGTVYILDTDYTITPDTSGTNTNKFTVAFTPAGIAKMTPNSKLTMTYSMKVLAVVPDSPIGNDATITVNDDTIDDSGEDVYTGGFNFKKIDSSNGDNPLAGAKFVVRDADSDTAKYLVVNDTTGDIRWSADINDAKVYTSADTTGLVSVVGLKEGTYYLEETEPPTNKYVELDRRISFVVTNNSFTTTTTDPTPVANKQKGTLPSTGGTGIYVMVAVGLVVMAGAGVWYVRSQRKEA